MYGITLSRFIKLTKSYFYCHTQYTHSLPTWPFNGVILLWKYVQVYSAVICIHADKRFQSRLNHSDKMFDICECITNCEIWRPVSLGFLWFHWLGCWSMKQNQLFCVSHLYFVCTVCTSVEYEYYIYIYRYTGNSLRLKQPGRNVNQTRRHW